MMIERDVIIPKENIEVLLRSHYRDIHAVVAKRFPTKLKSLIDINDIVQDVCIKAIRSFDAASPSNPRAWLMTIAKNQMLEAIAGYRTLKRDVARVASEDGLNGDDRTTVVMLQDLVVYRRTPSTSALRHEIILALEKALQAISKTHREVVSMRYLDGLSFAQAAAALGLTEGAARQLAFRALGAIRSELKSYIPEVSWTT